MARARTIKPGFFKNEDLCDLSPYARLLFAGLWTLADREGRLEDRPKRIKAEILPYENKNVNKLLESLETAGFITRYGTGDARFISIPTWHKHQNPHVKEPASTIPEPDENSASTVQEQCLNGSKTASFFNLNPITYNPESGSVTGHPPDSPPRPPATDTIASFVDRLYPISMKRKHRTAAEHAVVEAVAAGKIGDDGVSFDLVEQRWKAANATEDWKWKNGAKAQTLAEWITDGNYRYEVESEESEPEEHHYRDDFIPIGLQPLKPGEEIPEKPFTMDDLRALNAERKKQAG